MNRTHVPMWLLLGFLTLSSAQVCATSYSPPENFSSTSPGGGFKADATVTSTAHLIELRSMPSGRLLWSTEAETFLGELWLTDSGELLTRNYTTDDYVFYTSAGKPGSRFNLWSEIPVDERVRFCGEDWGCEREIWNFLWRDTWVEGARSWIYFRTYWGRIITLDCATGMLDRDPALAKRIEDTLLKNTQSWIASSPATFRGTNPTFCPYLDDKVGLHLFIIRAHRLKAGEPYLASALKELHPHAESVKYYLDRVYDPNALAKRLQGKAPMAVVLLVFAILIGIYVFLLGAVRKKTLAPS